MSGGWIFICSFWSYMTVFVIMARREYRAVRAELKGARVPAVYGHGWMTEEDKHHKALNQACSMIVRWPFHLFAVVLSWLITYQPREHSCGECAVPGALPEWDPTQDLIDKLDRELKLDQPGGVVVTRMPDPEPISYLPQGISVNAYLDLKHGPRNDLCTACLAVDVFNDRLKHGVRVETELGDAAAKPCTCGREKIKNLGRTVRYGR